MATVGTFTKNENGAGFTGAVKTLTSTSRPSSSPPRAKASAALTSASSQGPPSSARPGRRPPARRKREYLSVKLDDPSFPAPIYASLVEGEDGEAHNLIWSRRNGD